MVRASDPPQALIVGSGPNGLAAAIVLAHAGWHVTVQEAKGTIGGSVSSAELTIPGFTHDVCSSVYPLAAGSPFFRTLPLIRFGLTWTHPEIPLAHPLDNESAIVLSRSVDETTERLGQDRSVYRRLIGPLAERWDELANDILAPPQFPSSPLLIARFAAVAALPASTLAKRVFAGRAARALIAGLAVHSARPLGAPLTSAFALLMAAAGHAVGWPFASGGASRLAESLASHARHTGVEIETNAPVVSLQPPGAVRAVLCDLMPQHVGRIAMDVLPPAYRRSLARFQYGPGAFKLDWALAGPIPWRAEACQRAGTLHLGGTFEEIAQAEYDVARGHHPDRPFVLLAQPSVCDPSRAPRGRHTAWAYCHVPNGSTVDMTARIERQIERFAPGFQDLILARHSMAPEALEAHNPNLVGGDPTGGASTLRQTVARPTWRHYRTPAPWLYLCSAATPPGGGVHGMCGYHAAQAVLRDMGDAERPRR